MRRIRKNVDQPQPANIYYIVACPECKTARPATQPSCRRCEQLAVLDRMLARLRTAPETVTRVYLDYYESIIHTDFSRDCSVQDALTDINKYYEDAYPREENSDNFKIGIGDRWYQFWFSDEAKQP